MSVHEHNFYVVTGNCTGCGTHYKDEIARLRAAFQEAQAHFQGMQARALTAEAEAERLTHEKRELAKHLEDTVDPECREMLDKAEAVVRAAEGIQWDDVGNYPYMESPDVYTDLDHLKQALDTYRGRA